MARRRQSSTLEDLIEIMKVVFRYVPPWISMPLAPVAFFAISRWVDSSFKTPGLEKIGYLLGGPVALAILVGGVGGYRYRRRHAAFLRQNITLDWVNSLSWQEFENLVGEIFALVATSLKLSAVAVQTAGLTFACAAKEKLPSCSVNTGRFSKWA